MLHCLRALAQHSEESSLPKNIGWGGTKARDWAKEDHWVVFRFTSPDYRSNLKVVVARLLSERSRFGEELDDDPATRQRSR